MEKYIMALDQGSTSSRTILFDRQGNMIAQENCEFKQIFPKPGWVEHNPEEIWNTQLSTMRQVLEKAGIDGKQIEAIGITNQRETTVVWDKTTGKPVYNAIVWQCRRTSDLIDRMIKDGCRETICEKTGLVPDAYFSGTKIQWILEHTDISADRVKDLLFGTIDTWLMWKLSGGKIHATDYTNASRTMLFNIHTLEWDSELLSLMQIPKSMLPKVQASSGIFGYTKKELFGTEIPISGVAGDQQAALFGQCCFEKGDVKNTYGTGCFLLMNTGNVPVRSKNGLVTTIAASTGAVEYALEGSVFVAGAAIQWLRDEMKMIATAPESEQAALQVEDTGGVYVVPAFTGLGAPYWKQNARGMVTGLTRGTGREQFIRATLESLAYQTHDVLRAMEHDANLSIQKIKADGGASKNRLLMQFQADITGAQVVRPAVIETTGLGAAYLAGLALGVWRDTRELKTLWRCDTEFTPSMPEEERQRLLSGWQKAVSRSRDWAK